MKGIVNKIMLAVAAVLAFASCVKSEDAVVKELAGDWYYETVEADTPVQVYVSFAKDMTFELYQKVGEGAFFLMASILTRLLGRKRRPLQLTATVLLLSV